MLAIQYEVVPVCSVKSELRLDIPPVNRALNVVILDTQREFVP